MNIFHYFISTIFIRKCKIFGYFLCLFILIAGFSYSVFSLEEETVFELKREIKESSAKKLKKKSVKRKFKRNSFSYNEDFLIFNEKASSSLKAGSILRINIPYPVIASFEEEFPVYGVITNPFKGIITGKIRAIKNTRKALLVFDEVILNEKIQKIKSFPVFISGNLKESLIKDIFLSFFESLPSILALSLKSNLPQPQIQFINTDLKSKMKNLPHIENEKRKLTRYLELKNIKLFNVIIQ